MPSTNFLLQNGTLKYMPLLTLIITRWTGLAFWLRPKIFGQFGRPNLANGQNSQILAKFWPNNAHNIVLILIRNGLAFGRGQRFFGHFGRPNLAKRPNAN